MELDPSLVNDSPSQAVQGINLSNDCPLADSSKARIAGACSQIIELGRNQGRPRTGSRGSSTCLGAGMATSYNYNIKGSVKQRG
jgi:hypothetical protein